MPSPSMSAAASATGEALEEDSSAIDDDRRNDPSPVGPQDRDVVREQAGDRQLGDPRPPP